MLPLRKQIRLNHHRNASSTRSSCTSCTPTAREHGPRTTGSSGSAAPPVLPAPLPPPPPPPPPPCRPYPQHQHHLLLLWAQGIHTPSLTSTTPTQVQRPQSCTTKLFRRLKENLMEKLTTWPSSSQV